MYLFSTLNKINPKQKNLTVHHICSNFDASAKNKNLRTLSLGQTFLTLSLCEAYLIKCYHFFCWAYPAGHDFDVIFSKLHLWFISKKKKKKMKA